MLVFLVLPVGFGAITKSEALSGLAKTYTAILGALGKTLDAIIKAYMKYLKSLG